jgi:hypothetical protein
MSPLKSPEIFVALSIKREVMLSIILRPGTNEPTSVSFITRRGRQPDLLINELRLKNFVHG